MIFAFAYIFLFIYFGGNIYLYLTRKKSVNWIEFIGIGLLLSIIIVSIINQFLFDFFQIPIPTIFIINFIFLSLVSIILFFKTKDVVFNFGIKQYFVPIIFSVLIGLYQFISFFKIAPKIEDDFVEFPSDILQFSVFSNNLVEYGLSEYQILPGNRLNYYWLLFSHIGFMSKLIGTDSLQLHALYYPLIIWFIFVVSFINFFYSLGGKRLNLVIGFCSISISGAILINNFSNILSFMSLTNILAVSVILNLLVATKYFLNRPSFIYFTYFSIFAIGLSLVKTPMLIPLLLAYIFTLIIGFFKNSHFNIPLLVVFLGLIVPFSITYFLIFINQEQANALHLGNGFSELLFGAPYYDLSSNNLMYSLILFLVGSMILVLKLPGLILTSKYIITCNTLNSVIYFNFIFGVIMASFLYHAGGSNFHFLVSGIIPITFFNSYFLVESLKKFKIFKSEIFKILSLLFLFIIWYVVIFIFAKSFSFFDLVLLKFVGPILIVLYAIVIFRFDKIRIIVALFCLSLFIGISFQFSLNTLPYELYRKSINKSSVTSEISYYDTANGVSEEHVAAFDWIRENTSRSSIFLTNRFCIRQIKPPYSRPPFCQGDTFVLSAYSQRKVYVEGYRAESNTLDTIPNIISERVEESLKFIENPNSDMLTRLKGRGVNWIFVDKSFPYNRELLLFGYLRFENDKVIIFQTI